MRRFTLGLSIFSLAILSLSIFVGAALPPTAHATEYSYARIVRLSYVSGDVQVNRGGHSNWEQGLANMPIEQGFTIGTNDGRAEVEFEDGATIWIAENTVVQFTELSLSEGGRISHLTMAQGTVTAFANLKSADSFTLSAGQVQASVTKRAMFRMDAFHDGASISVQSGSVDANSPAGMKTVPHGETFAFNAKIQNTAALRQNPKSDSWDRWVSVREHFGEAGSAQGGYFANSPFTYGMGDMAAYGSWNYFPGYGYGWQPLGMGSCWMPFMDGQWASYPGLGWTWISDEPWGWVPYHFGSWNYSPAYGWMWMPGDSNSWDPAPVQWYDASNQIAWSPDMSYFGGSQMFLTGLGGGGCGGWPGGWQQGFFPGVPTGKKTAPVKPGVRGKTPVPPRFLLTAGKQLGSGGRVRILATGEAGASIHALPAPPQANGKFGRFSESADAAGSSSLQASRVVVSTAANLSQLQRGLRLSANGSAVAPMRLPSAPMPSAMPMASPIRNAGLAPASMPRPPAPMRFERVSPNFGGGGFSPGSAARNSAPSFPAPHSAPAGPAAPHASSGKPH
ncbi:MAG TPA: DUF6600 domain-containing protein [Candidatus Acidoferrales bacterium]|nr:DUF6600 domain-containing protein [Candidatus Acidoferrales bacterium]